VFGCTVLGFVNVVAVQVVDWSDDTDDDQPFVSCAGYGREWRLLPPIRLPDSEKLKQNSNLEQSSSFRYAEINHFGSKNL
jgi:hypothetical protein